MTQDCLDGVRAIGARIKIFYSETPSNWRGMNFEKKKATFNKARTENNGIKVSMEVNLARLLWNWNWTRLFTR